MNFNLVKRNKVFFISFAVSIAITASMYMFFFLNYYNTFKGKKVIYDRFSDINIQFKNFPNIQAGIDEKKAKIGEITTQYEDCFMSNDEIVNKYKLRIMGSLKEANIQFREQDVKQTLKDNGNIGLYLTFYTSYEQLYKFLFGIERFSSVSYVDMEHLGQVKMECSPYLYSAPVNDFFSGREAPKMDDVITKGYFKEISDKLLAAIDVGYIPTLRDLLPVPRNAFYNGFELRAKEEKEKAKSNANANPAASGKKPVYYGVPQIILDGIMYEEANPIVIIEGKLYHKGQTYRGAKIISIKQNSISVEYYGKVHTIKMQN